MDSSKPGLFYSPPKPNCQPSGGGANTSGNDSSTVNLIIPEESSDICIQKALKGKHSSRDGRHRAKHKHRWHEWQWKHGSLSSMFVCFHTGMFVSVQKQYLMVNYVSWFIILWRVSFSSLSLYLVQIQIHLDIRDVCHLIMKQNLFWGEEIVREFFVNFCFEKSSQLLHNYALVLVVNNL